MADQANKLSGQEQELKAAQVRVSRLQNELGEAKEQVLTLQATLKDQETTLTSKLNAECDMKLTNHVQALAMAEAKERRLDSDKNGLRQQLEENKAALAEQARKLDAEKQKCQQLEKAQDDCAAEQRELQESNDRTRLAARGARQEVQKLKASLQRLESAKVQLNETDQVQILQKENETIRKQYNELHAQHTQTSQKKKKIKQEYDALQLRSMALKKETDDLRKQLL